MKSLDDQGKQTLPFFYFIEIFVAEDSENLMDFRFVSFIKSFSRFVFYSNVNLVVRPDIGIDNIAVF